MAYNRFNRSKPVITDTRQVNWDNTRFNFDAIGDALVLGVMDGFVYSQSGGTAEEPGVQLWTNGSIQVRATNTWGSTGGNVGNRTSILWELSTDSGSTWSTIGAGAETRTYDASGNMTASTNFGGMAALLEAAVGKLKALRTSFNAHAASVVASGVHGLASMASQAASAVAITGGSINATALGATTPGDVDATRVRELAHDYGTLGAGATVTLELDKYGHFIFTPNATTSATLTVAFSGAPPSGRSETWTLEIIAGKRDIDGRFTWNSAFKWIGALRPNDTTLETTGGRNFFIIQNRDNGTRLEIQHIGKGG